MAQLVYDFDIVGGEFDGAPALAWMDDGKHPPPDVILVGVCDVGTNCGTAKCRTKVPHVSYWLLEEEGRPLAVVPYRKQSEEVDRVEQTDGLVGRAVYAIGGLDGPSDRVEGIREPTDDDLELLLRRPAAPFVPAGGWT